MKAFLVLLLAMALADSALADSVIIQAPAPVVLPPGDAECATAVSELTTVTLPTLLSQAQQLQTQNEQLQLQNAQLQAQLLQAQQTTPVHHYQWNCSVSVNIPTDFGEGYVNVPGDGTGSGPNQAAACGEASAKCVLSITSVYTGVDTSACSKKENLNFGSSQID